ncbi:cytochrome c-type biogenesis protein CcmH [Methylobacillus arboreus]|uniref:cytochrome c-type biogenesis protein n=1 Tax=Methylobacillus arboreus TaxID=755170 RepID=UPI002E1E4C54|nr:cytochrome c-type biogenesis protein CcmH [Methylobacillus arboreus]
MKYCVVFYVLLLSCTSLSAQDAVPLAADPKVEAQVSRLAEELRCVVCQNQTLADSDAPLAGDLRNQIREMAAQNMSDQEIVQYLVARYGDFVLYRPPFKATTALLWLGPFVLLFIAALSVVLIVRRRERPVTAESLSPADSQRLSELLKQEK